MPLHVYPCPIGKKMYGQIFFKCNVLLSVKSCKCSVLIDTLTAWELPDFDMPWLKCASGSGNDDRSILSVFLVISLFQKLTASINYIVINSEAFCLSLYMTFQISQRQLHTNNHSNSQPDAICHDHEHEKVTIENINGMTQAVQNM